MGAYLQEHGHGVLHVLLEDRQPLRGHRSVHHAVVAADGGGHEGALLVGALRLAGNDPLLRASHGEDGRLGGVDDGAELLNAHHAEVGDGEGPSGVVRGRQLVVARLGGQRLEVGGEVGETLGVRVLHDGHHQPVLRLHGDANVGRVVRADGVAHPGGVHGGHRHERERGGLDDEVGDGELHARLLLRPVQRRARRHQLVHLHVHREVVVGDLLLGLGEALRGDLLHHLDGHVREVGEEHGPVHATRRGGGRRARVAARLRRLHVRLRDAPVLARARDALQRHAHLP
mmetsp:Transcript_26727/g.58212  ORF Transcript_26727/g.58212 Transcript_26727/m.58212 type:complete len:287 (-) Transcript_26727:746-1606(-)